VEGGEAPIYLMKNGTRGWAQREAAVAMRFYANLTVEVALWSLVTGTKGMGVLRDMI
jgi:hypothetical protein